MRQIKVKVSNDSERDAVLKAWGKNGCKWVSGYPLSERNRPHRDYPYYLYRNSRGHVMHGSAELTNTVGDDFKKVPVERFAKFMKSEIEITIYSDGKTVKAVGKDGKIGKAKCSPEDKFDLRTGAKLAIDRLYGISAGDVVEIVSAGAAYNTYAKFFEEKNLPIDIASRFQYGGVPEKGLRGTVLGVYDHSHFCRKIAVVEIAHGTIYLMGVEGLKKV